MRWVSRKVLSTKHEHNWWVAATVIQAATRAINSMHRFRKKSKHWICFAKMHGVVLMPNKMALPLSDCTALHNGSLLDLTQGQDLVRRGLARGGRSGQHPL